MIKFVWLNDYIGKNPVDERSAFSTAPIAKLVTGSLNLVAKLFFHSPWRPKQSKLGALQIATASLQRAFNFSLKNIAQFAHNSGFWAHNSPKNSA